MPLNALRDWLELGVGLLGGGVGAALLNRSKLTAEAKKLRAETARVEAESEHIHFNELKETIRVLSEQVKDALERAAKAEAAAAAAQKAALECGSREAGLVTKIEQSDRRIKALEEALERAGRGKAA